MIVREPAFAWLDEVDDAQGQEAEAVVPFSSVQQQSGRWAYGQGARDLRERMDAILKPETMAGSPDADAATRAASRHLAHGFLFWGAPSFANS
jgi:hypothetical protein